jgi:NADPH:quinone reductase-like Zn-dependent oxidoreductase
MRPSLPAPGEVQVRVEAIGISWYDILWRQNLAPSQARLPSGLGHEMAGVVTAVGEGVDDLAVGDKVASFPAESPNDYPVYGEQIVLPRTSLTRYPDVLSPIEASVHYTLLIAYFAYVDLARVKPGQFALVTDASHCAGPSFVQLGKALGVRVIAATKTADEREYLLSLGAEKVIVTEEEDLLMRINKITDNRGVDVVFDGLGGPQMSLLGDVLAPRGSLVCMACKAATRRHSRPVRRSRRTFSSLCTASATSPASRNWASSRIRWRCSVPCATSTS